MALNKQERDLLDRVYECLNRLTGLQPLNPADIKRISENLKTCTSVAKALMPALFDLKIRDYEGAGEYLDDAERIIRERASR